MRRLTRRKVDRAALALDALIECDDLPAEEAGEFGNVKEHLRRTLVEDVLPLLQSVGTESDR